MDQKTKVMAGEQPAELEGVIKRILDIDAKARSVTAEAQGQRLQAEQGIADRKKAMREKYREEAEHRIELVREEEERMAEEALQRARDVQAEKLEALDEAFRNHADQWAQEIYRRTTEV